MNTVGQVVHTLPEGAAVLGVTSLPDEICLLRRKERDQVEVYDVTSYRPQRYLTVPDIRGFIDMTSCERHRCLYVADNESIHRLDVRGESTRWAVNDSPEGISVNAADNLLVTCRRARAIKEFSTRGDLVRQISLPPDVVSPLHAVQLTGELLIVCHGNPSDSVHRACTISADGRRTVHSHGGRPGSGPGQFRGPRHLAVDGDGSVFVADVGNRRVKLLSPQLNHVCHVVSGADLKSEPVALHLDAERRRLYVADNEYEWKNRAHTSGRVVVVSLGGR